MATGTVFISRKNCITFTNELKLQSFTQLHFFPTPYSGSVCLLRANSGPCALCLTNLVESNEDTKFKT